MITKVFTFLLFITMTYPSTGQNIVIANSNFNVLYIGIENRIDFASKTIAKKEILLSPQRGQILTILGAYVYINCNDSDAGKLIIYARNLRTKKIIDSVEFRLKRLPDPTVKVSASNMSGDSYKGTDLLKDFYGVTCFYSGDFTDQNCQVIGFSLTISHSSGTSKDIYVDAYRMTPALKKELAELIIESDSIIIHDIKVIVGCVREARTVENVIKLK